MNDKPGMSSAEVKQLLYEMAANNTLDVELTDSEIDLLLMNSTPIKRAEQHTAQALLKMQAAQRKREQRLPSFELGQYLANARIAAGLTVPQVAKEAAISPQEIETLEVGTWSTDQIVQKVPSNVMFRILSAIQLTVQDFGEELIEAANKAAQKMTRSHAYAWSRQSTNHNSVQPLDSVAEYINELQRLSP